MSSRNGSTFGKQTYTLQELLADVKKAVWTELSTGQAIDEFRRNLQKQYILGLINAVFRTGINTNVGIYLPIPGQVYFQGDALSVISSHLKDLQSDIKTAVTKTKDPVTVAHLKFFEDKIGDLFILKKTTNAY